MTISTRQLTTTFTAQCDRQQPTCGRCSNYRFECTWDYSSIQRINTPWAKGELVGNKKLAPHSPREHVALCEALQSFENLIKSLRPGLTDSDRFMVDSTVSRIRQRLPPGYSRFLTQADKPPTFPTISSNQEDQNSGSIITQTYHGRASDVHFLNEVKEMLQQGLMVNAINGGLNSYSQDHRTRRVDKAIAPFLPDKKTADKYADTYFLTIHIAYPFLCEPRFRSAHESFWQGVEKRGNSSWLSLLCKS